MLSLIKKTFAKNEVEDLLLRAKVDKSHSFIQQRHIAQLVNQLSDPKSKTQLLNLLYRGINCSDNTLRIKSYVILHVCLRKAFDEEICEVIMNQQALPVSEASRGGEKNLGDFNDFISQKVVNFYLLYLKKMCINKESIMFVRQNQKTATITSESNPNFDHDKNMELVSHGFKALNMTNYILQSQEMFNKMGRYHIQRKQIINMFQQLLEDITFFNNFLKCSVRSIIQNNIQVRQSLHQVGSKLEQAKIEVSKENNLKNSQNYRQATSSRTLQSSTVAPEEATKEESFTQTEAEETKHYFLYINQSQKVSDRLYQFYHNRYYVRTIKKMINFPSFLTIDSKDYTRFKSKIKKIDRDLVHIVTNSKYEGGFKTEPSHRLNMTVSYDRRHDTEFIENIDTFQFNNLTTGFRGAATDEFTIDEKDQY